MTTTFDGLRDIIVRDFELPAERLARDTPLEEIELDSLAVTELVFALEDEFHVTADHAVPAFVTLGDIADYIDRLIADRAANGLSSGAAANGRPPATTSAKSTPKPGKPVRIATERTSDSPAPPSRKPAGRVRRKPPARASANRGTAGAAQPQTPQTPKRRRGVDSARSDGRAR